MTAAEHSATLYGQRWPSSVGVAETTYRRLRRCIVSDLEDVESHLARDEAAHLILLARLARFDTSRPASHGVILLAEVLGRGQRQIEGVCWVQGERMALPLACSAEAAYAFGRRMRVGQISLDHVMGPRTEVDGFWRGYDASTPPRLDRRQRYYSLEQLDTNRRAEPAALQRATHDQFEPLLRASAAMYLEETLTDPMTSTPEAFRQVLRRRIDEGRAFVWMDEDGEVLFKADISTSCRRGALLSGIYTRPQHRGRGIARRGLHALCERLLAAVPRVTLYVNESNAPAVRLYESLGFAHHRPWRSVFIV